jgi:hypothetical protein
MDSVSPAHTVLFSPFSPTVSSSHTLAAALPTGTAGPSKSESHDNILKKAAAGGCDEAVTLFSRGVGQPQQQRRASDVGVFAVPFAQPASAPHASQHSPSRSSSSSSTSSASLALAKASQLPGSQAYSQREAPGKDQTSRKSKKAKPKGQTSKQRTIKFHEYKVSKTDCVSQGNFLERVFLPIVKINA